MFFRDIRTEKHYTLIAHENGEARASVGLTLKSILLLKITAFSKLLRSKVLSTNRSEFGRSTVQLVDNADS